VKVKPNLHAFMCTNSNSGHNGPLKEQYPIQKLRGVDLQTACYSINHGKHNF
jgi:hypothetical protein